MNANGHTGAGRPTQYKPEYCELAIEYGKKGMTIAMIASKIGKSKSCLHDWIATYPEFKEAMAISKTHAESYFLERGLKAADGELNPTGMVSVKFFLSACFGYRAEKDTDPIELETDKKDIEFSDIKPE